jgi:hypothetical protein
MNVSSGTLLPADNLSLDLLTESGPLAEPCILEDEEFPAELSRNHDWMLQPASQHNAKRVTSFVAVLLAVLLIATSIFLIHKLSDPSPAVLASPVSPLH